MERGHESDEGDPAVQEIGAAGAPELAGEDWARPYIERWALVEAMMTALDPVSWTRETQEDIARAVG